MSTDLHRSEGFTVPLRVLFALVAIATLLGNSPWEQADQLHAVTAYAGSAMWASLAVFGNKAGWRRHLTMAVAIVYLVLVVGGIFGFAG